MKFNHEIFYNHIRPLHFRWAKTGLNQSQVDGLNFLLFQIERDEIWKSIESAAYAFATVAWETAWTFQPIDERGGYAYFERRYGFQTKVGKRLGNDEKGEGAKYHGRGNVQLTGETNYENAEERLRRYYPALIAEFEARTLQKFDLTDFPDQAKDPLIAYAIMALGMHQGWFTGKSFTSYKTNLYLNWRRIINGTDHNDEIAAIAEAFEKALRLSLISESNATDGNPADTPASKPAQNSQKSETNSQPSSLDEPAKHSIQNNTEDAPNSFALPSIGAVGEYVGKAQDGINTAKESLDKLKILKDALDTRATHTDSKKSLWSTIGQAAYQAVWAVVAFFLGIPKEVWLVVAVIVGIVGIFYLYRQISLGKMRETARLKLIEIADLLK